MIRITMGPACSSAVSETGVLYTWGRMGFGPTTTDIHVPKPTPREVFSGHSVDQVAFAEHHCAVVTTTGLLWTWGLNSSGELGHGELGNGQLVPRVVQSLSAHRTRHVALGHSHTIAVTADGKVFVWGFNIKGHLGLGKDRVEPQTLPLMVTSLSKYAIHALACGHDHSLVVVGERPEGGVWAWACLLSPFTVFRSVCLFVGRFCTLSD